MCTDIIEVILVAATHLNSDTHLMKCLKHSFVSALFSNHITIA